MKIIKIRRIYDSSAPSDGYRVLVDRLWPRGIKKAEAKLDAWAKTVAPSAELRKRFAHQADRYAEFQSAYRRELDANPEALAFVRSCEAVLADRNITLLYAAKDEKYNNAAVLRAWVQEQVNMK